MDLGSRGRQARHTGRQEMPRPSFGQATRQESPVKPAATTVATRPEAPKNTERKKKLPRWPLILAATLILILAGWLVWNMRTSRVDSSRYQAVFLANGQVYFGKLHGYYGPRPYMTDVYYFENQNANASQVSTSQQLRKLGNEVHGPESELILNKDTIMFVENLKAESAIKAAIEKGQQGEQIQPTGSSN